MLTLNSIRIRNFRAIKDLTFKPQQEGITGIFGPNGAGKSTILTAVMFALYGSRPRGVTVAGLRRIGSGTEECSVSVVFTHLGQTVEVIRELKGAANNVVVNIYVDGKSATKTSGKPADRWIHQRLGVDAEGFLTAFVVRQKELDLFVRADPAERKKIIEKLAGVETINVALQKARDDEKDSRKTLEALPGSKEQVEASGSEIEYYTSQVEETEELLTGLRKNLDAVNEERAALNHKIQQSHEHHNQLVKIRADIAAALNSIPNLDAQIARLQYVKELKNLGDVDTLRDRYQQLRQQIQELQNKRASTVHLQQQNNQRVTELETLIQQDEQYIQNLKSNLTSSAEASSTQLAEINQKLVEKRNQITELTIQTQDLEESLTALQDSDDCPTCKTHLQNPDKLREQFAGIIKLNKQNLELFSVEAQELETTHAHLVQTITQHEQVQSAETNLQQNQTTLAHLVEETEQLPDITVLENDIETLTSELDKVVDLGNKAKAFKEDSVLYQQLLETRETMLTAVEQNRLQETQLTDVFSEAEQITWQRQLNTLENTYKDLNTKVTEAASRLSEMTVRFQNARSTYQRVFDQWEKKKALQDAHDKRSLTTDMLEEFRQQVVSSIAPELSEYATELISEMTNGDFVEITLDDDFKASIVDSSGQERPVAWLSGGEESAVALALRLSVAFLISGGNPELLWLDEPLTAQDKDRRAAILTKIRNLPIKQILMINHAQEAQDIVDAGITLTKD